MHVTLSTLAALHIGVILLRSQSDRMTVWRTLFVKSQQQYIRQWTCSLLCSYNYYIVQMESYSWSPLYIYTVDNKERSHIEQYLYTGHTPIITIRYKSHMLAYMVVDEDLNSFSQGVEALWCCRVLDLRRSHVVLLYRYYCDFAFGGWPTLPANVVLLEADKATASPPQDLLPLLNVNEAFATPRRVWLLAVAA